MPYAVALDKDNKIVMVRVSGLATIDEHLAARKKAFQLCIKKTYNRVLVDLHDLDTQGVASTLGCLQFGESLADEKLPKDLRIAHVLPEQTKSRSDVEFTSTVAANRGRLVAEFRTLEDARQWLLQ
jgi:hypothetical protein